MEWKRIASGDYETVDGRFRCYQLPGVNPPAWNVEAKLHDAATGLDFETLVVDGAATKRDALALFEDATATLEP